ncbi:MAG: hypothetical protein ACC669_11085 [bacterium]
MSGADAYELSGYAAAEGRIFFDDPLYPGQERDNVSIAIQPEFYHEWKNGSSFTFTPFARLDSVDSERSHFDVRELNYLWLSNTVELRIGISKVFWGVTESQHLVDIINQTDAVESIDGEDKLGQPMIHLSIPREWGVVEMFVLPYFRERTFPGEKGRLRTPVVDTNQAIYENSAKEYHIDMAIRYSHTIGNWDLGLSHFRGTGREPTLRKPTPIAGADSNGGPVLIPYYEYEIINQTGLDLQLVAGRWLWKLESIYRSGQGDKDFFAFTGGFEYTFTGVTPGGIDIGVLSEWLYDERGRNATTAFDNDVMLGVRTSLNDAAGTEALMGIIQDIDSKGRVFTFESSRRIGERWKISLDSFFVFDSSQENPIHALRKDDNMLIELSYYF